VQEIVIATSNPGKVREFAVLLSGLPVRLRSLAEFADVPEVPEEGSTFAENATTKALAYARFTGVAALADDSGLEVDALDGAPGVHSARYAGPAQDSQANIDKLLAELSTTAEPQRAARFRCVVVLAWPDGRILQARGVCDGRIVSSRRGDGGFGYDPIFFYPPAGMTFAEMPAAAKNAISHRARAIAALRPELEAFLATPS